VRGRAKVLGMCAAAASVLAVVTPATAQESRGELIDEVIAVVEDHALFSSDIELEYKRYLMQAGDRSMTESEKDELRKEILQGMVADLLMRVHAGKVGIEVKESDVQEAVDAAIEENKRAMGGDGPFKKQLEIEDLTLEELRSLYMEKLRARELIERLMYKEVMNEVEVSEGEIARYFEEHSSELPPRPATMTLAHILIVPKASEQGKLEAMEKVMEVEERITDGGDFAALAEQYSEGPSASRGGSLGFIKLEELNNPEFVEAVRGMEPGEISGPVLTSFGYHIIKLEGIEGDRYSVRHILVKVKKAEDDVGKAAELAESIRRQILDGADFGETAAEYSDDEGSRNNNGVVGEIPVENLPDFFLDVVEHVDIGEISPVIKENKGFRIVKVLGRSPSRPYNLGEVKEELRKLIKQQKLKERYQDYIESLKNLYHVEVKGEL